MNIHELNTKAITNPAYVALDDGSDTYKLDLNAKLSTMQSSISGAESDIATAQADITLLQTNMGQAQGAISSAQGEIEDLQSDLNLLSTQTAASIGNLQTEVDAVEDDVADLKGDLNKTIADIATVQTTTAAVKNYAVGDLLILNGQLYKVTSAISTGATITVGSNVIATTVEAELKRLDEEKADIYGTYPGMTVGNADQLNSTEYVEDKVPYKFRTSGGSADIGNREEDTIIGGTLAWNQLAHNGNFEDTSWWNHPNGTVTASDNVLEYTITSVQAAEYNNCIRQILSTAVSSGHKYLFLAEYKPKYSGIADLWLLAPQPNSSLEREVTGDVWNMLSGIFNATAQTQIQIAFDLSYATGGTYQVGDKVYVRNVMFIDLTQLFGTAIADYIFSVEQSQAGAGVALFRNLFPNSFYEYNAGTLMSVEGLESHDMVGFNQWDGIWESGDIDGTTGEPTTGATVWRTSNFIPVFPATNYYAYSPTASNKSLRARFYDESKNYIGYTAKSGTTNTDSLFMTPDNCHFMKLAPLTSNVPNHDICINLSHSGAKNGNYEPYEKHSYPLDSSLTLRGVPKLGADNKMYYDGDVYEADGTVTRRYGIVDLGTLTWTRQAISDTSKYRFVSSSITTKANAVSSAISDWMRSTKYLPVSGNDTYSGVTGMATNSQGMIIIYDESFATYSTADFKTAVSGVYLVYELATPTTETADPYASHQVVNDWGTEEYVSGNLVPVGHDTKYPANLRDKLQHLPSLATEDGIYAIQQSGSGMTLVHIPADVAELPDAPTSNGAYTLKATVSDGVVTYSWT